MLSEILVISVTVRYFTDLVTLLTEDYKLFLRRLRGAFWFVKTSETLAHILNTPAGKPFEAFGSHKYLLLYQRITLTLDYNFHKN